MRTLCLIAFLFLVSSANAKDDEIVVCNSCEVKSLELAVSLAQDGDVILLRDGLYSVSGLIIEKSITIRGEGTAILDGGGQTILYIHHDSVTVENITLQHVETNYVEDRAALKCNDSDYLHIKDVKIRDSFFGIMVEKSKHGVVENCDIEGNCTENSYLESANGNAIHMWYCKDMIIRNNTLKKHRDGIYFEFVDDSSIHDNWSEGNMRYGLHFMFSHHNDYLRNTFIHNGAGVAVMYSSFVTMVENNFRDNWSGSSYGLLLKDISDSEMRSNLFDNNTIAISADNSSRLKVINNRFSNNGYAMRILGNCDDDVIRNNDFIGNTFDITTNSRTSHNDFSSNYWEEYAGYDLDNDGVGDIPFRPVKLFTNIIAQSPTSIILMRSTFIDLLNLAEKVTPVLTPENLIDNEPSMYPFNDNIRVGLQKVR